MIDVNCRTDHMLGRATKVFDVKTVLDTQTTGPRKVPVRWYVPEDKSNDAPPVIVYFHGGGWATGMLCWTRLSLHFCLENKDKLRFATRWSLF